MSERDLIDPDMSNQQMRLHFGEMTAQEMRTARAAIRFANSRASTTIARLSEALAEAEKKGAEARAKALEDAIEAIRAAAVTTTLSGDDAASFCNGADWMEGEAIKAIRDLSQGGQHG